MYDFIIAYMAIAVISSISRSYREDIILSLLVLIPIVLIMIIYTRSEYKKMGKQLIKLRKTPSVLPGTRATSLIFILFAIFLGIVSYFGKHRIGVSWLILVALQIMYSKFIERTLEKGLMSNGLWTGNRLIHWGSIKSYKWTEKKEGYSTLKMGYFKYFSFHIAFLKVSDEQKEEVDELFKKMVRI